MEQIGPYRVVEELARGGMGVVYRAVDAAGRPVALKQILPDRATSPRKLKRFAIETEAQARLDHPGVVRILATGTTPAGPWFAMELVEGETLAARLQRGPLGIAESIRVTRQLAEALSYVHEQGILHRDLKPDNVILGEAGRARLTDFGLALDSESDLSRLTQTGVFLGTPGYWAPEQGKGDKARFGPALDLYGLGAVLYACLTGAAPVNGATLYACLASGMFERIVPPHERRPEVPEWLSALCMRCLAADPRARPASAYLVRRALLAGEDLGPQPRSLRRLALGAAALAGLSLLGLVAAVASRGAGAPPPPASEQADPAPVHSARPTLAIPRELPTVCRLPAPANAPASRAVGLFEPWSFSASPSAIRLHGVSPGRPELALPLVIGPGAWELRASFSELRLVTSGYLMLALHSPARGEEHPASWLGWLLKLDQDWTYKLAPLDGDPKGVDDWVALHSDPRGPLSVVVRFEEATLSLEVTAGAQRVARVTTPVEAGREPAGPGALRLGLVSVAEHPSLGLATKPYYSGHLDFELTELHVAGDYLHLDPERTQAPPYREGQVGYLFASGADTSRVRARVEELMRASLDDSTTTLLPYLMMWLDLREGELEAAGRRLKGIQLVSRGFTKPVSWTSMRNWARNRILADFSHYPTAFLPFVAEVLAQDLPTLEEALDTALKPKEKTDKRAFASPYHERLWAWVEVSLLHATSSEPPWAPFHPLRVGYQAGRFEATRDALSSLGSPPPASPQEADWRGWLHFWVGDYARCVETWAHATRTDGPQRRALETARRWSNR